MKGMDPETLTVAFFAREEGRHKAPAALRKAVDAAGGQIAEESNGQAVGAAALARRPRAAELGLELDPQGARALVAQVGDRQQRLLRELEKLALEHGEGARLGVEEVEESCASSAERKVWTLADALVAGDERRDARAARAARAGRARPGLLYGMVRRLRDALAIAEALAAGSRPPRSRSGLRMPSFAADRLIADVAKRDVEAFRRALELMADLELESRGGGAAACSSEDTAAVRAVIGAAR